MDQVIFLDEFGVLCIGAADEVGPGSDYMT
jgi:hypothetical protein